MKKKFSLYFFCTIIFLICSNNTLAKPRCEVLYDNIYNDIKREDVNFSYIQEKKNYWYKTP